MMKAWRQFVGVRSTSCVLAFACALTAVGWRPARSEEARRPVWSAGGSRTSSEPARHPVAREVVAPTSWIDDSVPTTPPTYPEPCQPPRVVMGPLDVIHESIFGPASPEDWKPLTLRTFFTEGWDEPFHHSPEGTNGAPKDHWIGTASGTFGRFYMLDFVYTNNMSPDKGLFLSPFPQFNPIKPPVDGDHYNGFATVMLPLNSRMEILFGGSFISANKSSPNGGYVGNFGDLAVQARFHLIDQRNFSMIALLSERIPTGKSVNGNGINYVTPSAEFWWNFAPKWVLRGGTGINILTGRRSATSVYFTNTGIGRYLTDKDARHLKELVVHLTVSTTSDVSGGAGHINEIYLLPGFRCGLGSGQRWYAMGGIEVPVSSPHPYDWQPNFSLVKNF